ncbi:MAG TPA: LamG domain-containing protein [Verrucomicrobia bacterium]|nr:LamG domain-containing protein [Verrucomicrobiota bacterium]
MSKKLLLLPAFFCFWALSAQAQLGDGLVAYWPLDEIQGTKTPEKVNGYDMDLSNLSAEHVVEGIKGNAFEFSNTDQRLLSRVHSANDELPANQHESYTLSMWSKVDGNGQNDLRLFSEGDADDSNPLFNIGTDNGGGSGAIDLFFRQSGWDTVNHLHSIQEPYDGTWHHVVFRQENGVRSLYVDGVLDSLEIPAKEEGDWRVSNTTIGGILRASASHWVSGLIDEVAVWKRALSEEEILQVNSEGLDSVFPPLGNGLVAYWPLNEIQGTKTPELVNGYDMDLTNLTDEHVVEGFKGNAFEFSNTDQRLLSRVHAPNDDLPANKHESFTLSMWSNVQGTGQNDLRLFSEGDAEDSNPLFNIGTHNGGTSGAVDLFFRQSGWSTVGHIFSTQEPYDGTWHHVAFVQDNGVRSLYVDGVLDQLEIAAKEEGDWRVSNTTIGGILRASASHWVSGAIDDVAIWKRALSPTEIASVISDGVPQIIGGSKLPLRILRFSADFSGAAAGSSVALRWDVSGDAQVEIDNGVGDVTAITDNGVGTTNVVIEDSTVFKITITRGDESLSAISVVVAVADVMDGWNLLEDFNTLGAGSVAGQGSWLNPQGIVRVIDLGTNKSLGFDGSGDLAALVLNSLKLKEGQQGTLFFRVFTDPLLSDGSIGINIGLTEKPIRFNGDFGGNFGPHIQISKDFGAVDSTIFAINGPGGFEEFGPEFMQLGEVYNFWMDVTNRSIAEGDLYTVYMQKDGDAGRTLMFQDLVSDRDPAGSVDLGLPKPDLTHVVMVSTGNDGIDNIHFDDFYFSLGEFNDSVPVPPSSFEFIEVPPPTIEISGSLEAEGFAVTWNSVFGETYSIEASDDLREWFDLAVGFPEGGATGLFSLFTDPSFDPNVPGHRSYRVVQRPLPALLEDDFENGAPGWTIVNPGGTTQWELGTPANGPAEANSGTNAYGTDLDGDYAIFTDTSLRSPAIDLSGVKSANLEFAQFLDVEPPEGGTFFDGAEINILDANDNLLVQLSVTGGRIQTWRNIVIPIPDNIVGQVIKIEFRLYSDDFEALGPQAGWYIDDVAVRGL